MYINIYMMVGVRSSCPESSLVLRCHSVSSGSEKVLAKPLAKLKYHWPNLKSIGQHKPTP